MGFECDFEAMEGARETLNCVSRIGSKSVLRIGCAAQATNARAKLAESLRKWPLEHTYSVRAEALVDIAATDERLRAVKPNPLFH